MREKGDISLIRSYNPTPEDASTNHPFYLDIAKGSVIIFDRWKFMKKRLEKLKDKLSELKARKVLLADGKWYWELKPEIKKGKVIEL
ncbi:MAG TPA: hypothetical protein EYP68_02745 [Candidatus Korarchaeota archaeon]|nr:hypothetical protein [Candidatus Korarchaeota archaeon]